MRPLLKSRIFGALYLLLFALAVCLILPPGGIACWSDGPGPGPGCGGGGGGGGEDEPKMCPIEQSIPPSGCAASAANSGPSNRITYHSGNIFLTIPMFHLTTRGDPVSIYLTYNSQGESIDDPSGRGWQLSYGYFSLRPYEHSWGSPVRTGLTTHIVKTYPDRRSVEFGFNGVGKYGWMEEQGSEITFHQDGTFTEEFKDGATFNYNTAGQLVEMVSKNGHSTFIDFDESGRIQAIQLAQSEISFIYAGSALSKIVAPDSTEYSLSYADGNLISYSTPEGVTTTFTYDGNRRLIQKSTEGKTVSYQYENKGRVSARTDENGYTTYYEYYPPHYFTLEDEIGATKIIDPLGNYRIIGFDDGGRWTHHQWFTEADELIKEERAFYGGDGKLVSFIDGEGNRTHYEYDDGRGNINSRADGLGNYYIWEYDANNDLIRQTDPRRNVTEYEYDANRNLTATTWYIGTEPVTETRSYTHDGVLAGVTNPRGYTTEYETDDNGNITKISEPLGKETTLTYDVMNRMLTRTEKIDEFTSRTTEYEYNDDGKRTQVVYDDGSFEEFHYSCCALAWQRDRNGNYTYYSHDGKGKIITKEWGDRVTDYEYDANDNLAIVSVHDQTYGGRITENAYDGANRLIETRNRGTERDLLTRFTYTGADKMKTRSRQLGEDWIATEYFYDGANRMTRVVENSPSGPEVLYDFDANGNRIYVTDPEGRTTQYGYDERNRLVLITNDTGVGTRFVLDEAGNRIAVVQAAGTGLETTVEYEYDALNRLVKSVDPLENETEFSYNLLGNTLARTDANGNVTEMAYDSNGRLISQTNAEDHTVEYEYDYVGNRTKLTDPRGNETDFAYNEFNEVIIVTYPDSSFEAFSYDRSGNKIATTTRAGQVITYDYDLLNRLVKKTYPDSTETTFAYDQLGRITGAANTTAGYSFFYNELNRLLEYNLILEGEEYAVSYGWDPVGNKTGLTYPGGTEYTRHYDNLNRLERVENSAEAILAEYAYDDLNRRTRLDYLNGTWAEFSYNDSGWLTDLVNWRNQTEAVSAFAYTHDNIGNRTSMTTPDGTNSYGYDDIYQLTAVDYPAGYPFPDMTYYYDAAYNRTTTVNGGEVDYLSNNLNQYTSVGAAALGYDDNGNLTGDGTQTYYYDVENRLTRAVRNSDGQTLGEYTYDPFGRRIVKEAGGATTHYIYDHLSYQVLAEYADGGGGFSQARRFVYGVGIDEPLVMETGGAGGGSYFYHRDGLGSIANLTDETGQTSATYRYDVYGNFQLTGSAHGNPYIFTGRRLDEETGLYFYRARYYSPGLGRFLQVDPIGYGDGCNIYAYGKNSVIDAIDPFGKRVQSCFWAIHFYIKITDSEYAGSWGFAPKPGVPRWKVIMGCTVPGEVREEEESGSCADVSKDNSIDKCIYDAIQANQPSEYNLISGPNCLTWANDILSSCSSDDEDPDRESDDYHYI